MGNFPEDLYYRNVRAEDRQIIEKYLREIPTDVKGLVKEFKIKLASKSWPDNISGVLDMQKRQPKIFYNQNHSTTRQRFTIAHELGHYILHGVSGLLVEDSSAYFSSLSRTRESEANRFAADILMPRNHIEMLASQGEISIPQMAAKLEVSVVAMSIRLGFPT